MLVCLLRTTTWEHMEFVWFCPVRFEVEDIGIDQYLQSLFKGGLL